LLRPVEKNSAVETVDAGTFPDMACRCARRGHDVREAGQFRGAPA